MSSQEDICVTILHTLKNGNRPEEKQVNELFNHIQQAGVDVGPKPPQVVRLTLQQDPSFAAGRGDDLIHLSRVASSDIVCDCLRAIRDGAIQNLIDVTDVEEFLREIIESGSQKSRLICFGVIEAGTRQSGSLSANTLDSVQKCLRDQRDLSVVSAGLDALRVVATVQEHEVAVWKLIEVYQNGYPLVKQQTEPILDFFSDREWISDKTRDAIVDTVDGFSYHPETAN